MINAIYIYPYSSRTEISRLRYKDVETPLPTPPVHCWLYVLRKVKSDH